MPIISTTFLNMLGLMFNELSEEQHKYWREILAENFDYDEYEKKWKLIDLVIKSGDWRGKHVRNIKSEVSG